MMDWDECKNKKFIKEVNEAKILAKEISRLREEILDKYFKNE